MSKKIKGYHVVWQRPRKHTLSTWEILLQLTSAKVYQSEFGPIHLYACQEAIEFFDKIGMTKVYDGVEALDEDLLQGIDPDIYFASAKVLAQLQAPDKECAFVDTDLILLRTATEEWETNPVVSCLHKETLEVYPDLWKKWKYDGEINDALPINCAFNLWKDRDLRREYASRAMKFMNNNTHQGKFSSNTLMITAEQRILGMFLEEKGITPNYYVQDVWSTGENEWIPDGIQSNWEQVYPYLSHVWGFKKELHTDPMKAADFSLRLITMLDQYPEIELDTILNKLANL